MDFTAIFIIGFIVLGTYKLFELFAKRKERQLMIEKLAHLWEGDEDNEKRLKIQLPLISADNPDFGYWPLRISLLLIGIGLGCLLSFFLQSQTFGFNYDNYWDYYNHYAGIIVMINFATITTLGGIGLLIAFLIEQKMKRKKGE